MTLASALNAARSSLLTTAKQLAVSGSNIAGADDATYTRKIIQPVTSADGAVTTLTVTRATDLPLFYRLLDSNSSTSTQQALLDGLDQLQTTIGDTADNASPAAKISALLSAITAQANAPSDTGLAQGTLTAAQDLASALNQATDTVTSVRTSADQAMATSVAKINDLLSQFATINTAVLKGSATGSDVTDLLDQRDALLGKISAEIGISVVQRDNNDIAIYTDSGVTLFDKTARSVTFQSSTTLTAGSTGNAVYVDGVPVTGANASMPISGGALAGLAQLRDTIAPTYQAQLDEMARGLVSAFVESDQSGGGGSDLAGLFTWSGGPAVPATYTAGLAGSLSVNAAVDPSEGGSLSKLRDGGINGSDYVYNDASAASFSERLSGLATAMTGTMTFDSSAGLESGASLSDFATASVSWLSGERKSASDAVDYQSALQSRTSDALSNSVGVNVDNEYALQLQLEQSYQASSKLISIVNSMFQTLLDAVA